MAQQQCVASGKSRFSASRRAAASAASATGQAAAMNLEPRTRVSVRYGAAMVFRVAGGIAPPFGVGGGV